MDEYIGTYSSINNKKTNTLTYIKGQQKREKKRENTIKALGKILKTQQIYINVPFSQQSLHCSYLFIYAITPLGKYIILTSQNEQRMTTFAFRFPLPLCDLTPHGTVQK